VIITLGDALLGFVAGEMLVSDHATEAFFQGAGRSVTILIEAAGAAGVVVLGQWLARRKLRAQAASEAPGQP